MLPGLSLVLQPLSRDSCWLRRADSQADSAHGVHSFPCLLLDPCLPRGRGSPALTSIALEKIAIVTQECIPVIAAAYSDQPLTAYVEAAVLMQTPWSISWSETRPGDSRSARRSWWCKAADPLVPADTTEAWVRRSCQLGTDVQLRLYPEAGHGAVIAVAMPDMLAWAIDRMAEKPVASTC